MSDVIQLSAQRVAMVDSCSFVAVVHAEVDCARGIDRGLVERLMANHDLDHHPSNAGLDARQATLLAFVRRLAGTPNAVQQAAVFGFATLSRDVAARHAAKRVERGYANLYAAFRQPASPRTE